MTTDVLELGKQRASELGLESIHKCWKTLGTPMLMDVHGSITEFYYADDIHKLLGEGVLLHEDVGGWYDPKSKVPFSEAKRQAMLIGFRPIVQESREQKLENMLRFLLPLRGWKEGFTCTTTLTSEFIKECKALLEGK